MPIYEYHCESCGHDFEAMQKFSDPLLTECPSCGKATLKKLVSAAGFQLKGTGWYATDFKGGAKKSEAKSETDSSSSSSSSESSSSSSESSDATSSTPKKQGCGTGGCGCH